MASDRLVVGLTGGIGCGKSVVTEELGRLGVHIVDADRIAHALSCPPSPAIEKLVAQFGEHYIQADGCMDRGKMRALAFSDPAAKKKLENIFHPLIREEMQRQLTQAPPTSPYSVLAVPLLFEVPSFLELAQYTVVIDCLPEQQLERVQQRNALDPAQIAAIMASQLPRQDRLQKADFVISNGETLPKLYEQVHRFHLFCQEYAKRRG